MTVKGLPSLKGLPKRERQRRRKKKGNPVAEALVTDPCFRKIIERDRSKYYRKEKYRGDHRDASPSTFYIHKINAACSIH